MTQFRQFQGTCLVICVHNLISSAVLVRIERFSYDLEMKTREQNRNNKRTEIKRFDWFIEWIQTRLAFGWLSKRAAENLHARRTF